MFFAILYTLLFVLLLVRSSTGQPTDGARAWQANVILWLMLAIVGWVLFERYVHS